MKHSEILAKAKQVIKQPEAWTTGAFSRNQAGERLSTGFHNNATCFCALGAIEKATGKDFFDVESTVNYLQTVCVKSIATFNDYSTHEQVLEMFDKAIALAQADEVQEAA